MREVVLDASVLLKWFHSEREPHVEAARALRTEFEAGQLRVTAPSLLWLEIINVAARRWQWPVADLDQLASTLPALGFLLLEPEVPLVARWAAAGLTAYDAAYVAVAEQTGVVLTTDDREIQTRASNIAIPLSPEETGGSLGRSDPLPPEPGVESPSERLRRLREDER